MSFISRLSLLFLSLLLVPSSIAMASQTPPLKIYLQNGIGSYGYDDTLYWADNHAPSPGHYKASEKASTIWWWVGGGMLTALGAASYYLSIKSEKDDDPLASRRSVATTSMPNEGPAPTQADHNRAAGFINGEMERGYYNKAVNQHYALSRNIKGQGVTIALSGNGVAAPGGAEMNHAYAYQVDVLRELSGQTDTSVKSGKGIHDTLVANMLVGKRNNIGTHGIAPNARLIDFKAASNDYARFISYQEMPHMIEAMKKSGARILTQSWDYRLKNENLFVNKSPSNSSRAIGEALAGLHAAGGGKGAAYIVPAGNRGWDNPDLILATMPNWFPVLQTQMIAVVAINGPFDPEGMGPEDFQLAPYSSACGGAKSWCMAAPGDQTRVSDSNGVMNNLSGTSAATPVVAGSLALIMSAFPEVTAEQAIRILFDTARDIGAPGVDPVFGHGLPDLEKALRPVGATTITSPDGSQSSTSVAQLDMPAAFGGSMNGAASYTFQDSYGRYFEASLQGNQLSQDHLGLVWQGMAPVNGVGFMMGASPMGGLMAVFGNDMFYLSSIVENDALHGARGDGVLAWKGVSITQGAHLRTGFGDSGISLEIDAAFTHFKSGHKRIISSMDALIWGAKLRWTGQSIVTERDSLAISAGMDPSVLSGTMSGFVPKRDAVLSYKTALSAAPRWVFDAKYIMSF